MCLRKINLEESCSLLSMNLERNQHTHNTSTNQQQRNHQIHTTLFPPATIKKSLFHRQS
eukprot:m.55544 g.55544  ORF g.55544 m.55544 type:complete len:59 (+) comp18644_c0_seq2:102-278(+)